MCAFHVALFFEQTPSKISDNHKEFQLSVLGGALNRLQN